MICSEWARRAAGEAPAHKKTVMGQKREGGGGCRVEVGGGGGKEIYKNSAQIVGDHSLKFEVSHRVCCCFHSWDQAAGQDVSAEALSAQEEN